MFARNSIARMAMWWLATPVLWAQQPSWFKVTSYLTAREAHAMAYDAARGEIVLFGGADSTICNDTWVWDGVRWVQKFPLRRPPARMGHAMAYDAARGQVVLFGGHFERDTWVWDGANWVQKFPPTSPESRAYHVMAYDPARQRVVLFGGFGRNDTWVWNGSDWAQEFPPTSPPLRGFGRPTMVYDAAHRQLVLFGVPAPEGTNSGSWLYGLPVSSVRGRLAAPGAGTGASEELTFVFEHPSGWQAIEVANALINFWLDGRQACYVAYVPRTGALYLVDDWGNAGGPFAGGLVLGRDAARVGNSQCEVDGSQSWAEHDGYQVRLHLKLNFTAEFAGTRIVYLAVRDAVNNSGWQRLGVWKVPGASGPPDTPEVVGFYPAEWTGRDAEALELTVRDPQGAGDVAVVNLLVNDWLDGRQACYVAYVPALNAVFLVDDAGNAGGPFAGGVLLGANQTAANNQCTIYGEGSSASASGQQLRLRLRVQFKSGFAGHRVVYAAVRDQANHNSGWQAVGRRKVP